MLIAQVEDIIIFRSIFGFLSRLMVDLVISSHLERENIVTPSTYSSIAC